MHLQVCHILRSWSQDFHMRIWRGQNWTHNGQNSIPLQRQFLKIGVSCYVSRGLSPETSRPPQGRPVSSLAPFRACPLLRIEPHQLRMGLNNAWNGFLNCVSRCVVHQCDVTNMSESYLILPRIELSCLSDDPLATYRWGEQAWF